MLVEDALNLLGVIVNVYFMLFFRFSLKILTIVFYLSKFFKP